MSEDFYEDDEDPAEVLAAFLAGEHGWTRNGGSHPSSSSATTYVIPLAF